MSSEILIQENEGKVDYILKAAQTRLGLYGYEKTTMQEIADDIGMSKASLYYYFPDKESMFKAVLMNEQREFFLLLEQKIASIETADQMILEFVQLRQELFNRFHNLSKFRLIENHKVKPLLVDLYNELRKRETEILITILNKGKEDGIFSFGDTHELALLFSDLLQGIRIMEKKRMTSIEMTTAEKEHMVKMVLTATQLFINGLKYNTAQNK